MWGPTDRHRYNQLSIPEGHRDQHQQTAGGIRLVCHPSCQRRLAGGSPRGLHEERGKIPRHPRRVVPAGGGCERACGVFQGRPLRGGEANRGGIQRRLA